ncbi:hypothetical protein PQX77_006840 [Marasmius sp. AFHP31]|nr:hypothetical protein PQX77_006840 [Marasmius sp. AFHP31]
MAAATFFSNAQKFSIHGGDFNPVGGNQHRTSNNHTNCSTMGSYNATNTVRKSCGNRSTRNTYRVHQQTASGSMIGPSSGVYYIKNIRTGYFLTTEGIGSGEKIWTDSAKVATPAVRLRDQDVDDKFGVLIRRGFFFHSAFTSLKVAECIKLSSVARVSPLGPEFQEVAGNLSGSAPSTPGPFSKYHQESGRTPVDDTYWFDEWKQGRWVVLSKGSTSDENNWRLISAAI